MSRGGKADYTENTRLAGHALEVISNDHNSKTKTPIHLRSTIRNVQRLLFPMVPLPKRKSEHW